MAVISTLTVNLIAETGKFENGLKKSRKSADNFGKSVKKAMKAGAIALGVFTVALGALVAASLKMVDQQRKTARTLGTSQAIFAGLSLAAGIAGSSIQSFTKALKRQQKSIVDASDGLQTQKRAFDRLGLSTRDLINLPVEEQFKAITTALGTVENATLKVAIASDIFGAKNADLINIIDLGAEGIDKYIQKVKDLGVALTDNQTNAIEEANDAVLIMKTSFEGLGNQLAARFAPVIKTVAGFITNITSNVTASIPKWQAWAASIFGVERALSSLTLADLNATLTQLQSEIGDIVDLRDPLVAMVSNFPQLVAPGNLRQLDEWDAALAKLIDRYAKVREARDKLLETGEVNFASGGAAGEVAGITKAAKKSAFGFDRTGDELKRFKAVTAEFEKHIALFDEWEREAAAAITATRTPLEALMIELERLRANPFIDGDLQQRSISEAVAAYQDALKKMKEDTEAAATQMTEFQRQAFSNMQDILSEFLFDPWDEGLDGMLKSFVTMLRKMVAQLLATKLLNFFLSTLSPASSGSSILGTALGVSRGHPVAIGGQVERGKSHLVGENGPEIFSPGASGSVRPIGAVEFSPVTTIGGGDGLNIATLIPILEENNKMLMADFIDKFDRGAFN